MRTHTVGLTAVIVLAAASPVFAQEHQHQPGQQRPADMAARNADALHVRGQARLGP